MAKQIIALQQALAVPKQQAARPNNVISANHANYVNSANHVNSAISANHVNINSKRCDEG